ncbi:sigma-70 family RNA polymerase sigma factor [Microbacterium azadirachtae]|uniref:ECF RNA polymerase sigma factor SigL n=1 Tax=Microbacterium azadirachtae TaxID=582680 RepID=A0A0F0KK45_9MICO|nr:sigma-70 family RNA polymerase sigma factor [Microbacterium azadirachtae]KJL20809.1 ECF RNA polymerase sigma factor SigL [Microbacterium azadirachtae]UXW86968.1 sigma-70 family RNA polymerase sigma factor [Microbacterium azadirachtae]SDM29071.1 RNA polymerase sigma-70 factor, ECF subfamily [Microbacterium azadirachtae]SEG48229.1 RNA polymerase sigma-70 factor, ECF subfamily [Microbacterium azadirachtae]SEG51687.1 RNA polymerase sigma-70 factor, ECF subfamily [Microbacterium azadirachtae]
MEDEDERLTALYDVHAGPIRRYVVRLTGSASSADDVVQETLLRAWRTPRILEQEAATTRAWMFTVARNLVIDEARSARRRHEHPVAEVPERATGDTTDRLFDAILIEDALADLSAEHRAVIVAGYYGGRSVDEIAQELAIPAGTVKSRMHYGLRALRLALQERGVIR